MNIANRIKDDLVKQYGNYKNSLSTYLVGSLAAGEFNSKISDLDLFTVARRPPSFIEQKETLIQASNLWFDFKENIFTSYIEPENVLRGDNEFYYNDEFLGYLSAFPSRVWMPFHLGIWYNITGDNIIPKLPPTDNLLRHDLFVSFNYFYDSFYSNQAKAYWQSKNLRRAITKVVWLITGKRPNRNESLHCCAKIIQHPSLEFLIDESEKISNLAYKYNEEINIRRFLVEGGRLLNHLKQQYFNPSNFDSEIIRKLEIHQSLYVNIRNSRYQFSCTVHPEFSETDSCDFLSNILYQSFIEDLKLITNMEFNLEIEEVAEYLNSHYNWLSCKNTNLLNYYQSEFFVKREIAHKKLLSILPKLV